MATENPMETPRDFIAKWFPDVKHTFRDERYRPLMRDLMAVMNGYITMAAKEASAEAYEVAADAVDSGAARAEHFRKVAAEMREGLTIIRCNPKETPDG